MNPSYLDAIRKFEGFTPQAQWDYAQHTNGYGTKALFAGEVIDKAEADRRFQAEITEARRIVERHAPQVDEGTKAALTSLTFNAGDRWARSGLGDAIRNGDLDQARALFVQYNKAGGEVLPGLVARRLSEAAWIGGQAGAESGRQLQPANLPTAAVYSTPTPPSRFAAEITGSSTPVRTDMAVAAASDPLVAAAPVPSPPVDDGERDGDESSQALIRGAVASFGKEAKLTQLLLAAQFLDTESAKAGKSDRDGEPAVKI